MSADENALLRAALKQISDVAHDALTSDDVATLQKAIEKIVSVSRYEMPVLPEHEVPNPS